MASITAHVTPDPDQPERVVLDVRISTPDGLERSRSQHRDVDDAAYAAGMELVTRLRAEASPTPPGDPT
jgi:hypothetical protein